MLIKEKILNAFLENTDIKGLTVALSEIFGCPIIIADSAFRIVSGFAPQDFRLGVYERAVSHGELSLETCTELSGLDEKTQNGTMIGSGERRCRALPLYYNGTRLGYLLLAALDGKADVDGDGLGFAAALIAKQLHFESGNAAEGTAEEIMRNLLDGKYKDEEHFALCVSSTFLSNFSPERLAVIDISACAGDENRFDFLTNWLKTRFHGSHPFVYKNRIVLFVHADHDIGELETPADDGICVAVSAKLNGIFSAKEAYSAAAEVLDYLLNAGKTRFCVKTEKYALVTALRSLEHRHGLVRDCIKELYLADEKNGGALCETLYAYLICHHSLKDTCEMLYTHRNTVLYRINKIKSEFGVEIDDPNKHTEYLLSAAILLCRSGKSGQFAG